MPDQPARPAPKEASAVDDIVGRIRAHIASQGLSAGDRLPTERELCERFGAGRNTVREAMRILKAFGLVEVRPKVGATLADNRLAHVFEHFAFNSMAVSPRTFLEVQELRSLLEVGSAELLIERARQHDIDELRACNAALADARDVDEAAEADFRFHLRLVTTLGNTAMVNVYTAMRPVIMRIMAKGKTRRTFRTETFGEHEGVLDALAARDALAYRYLMRNHLITGFRHLEAEMDAA